MGKNPFYLQKSIHTVVEGENVKPFSETELWTLLTPNCIALSTLCTDLPRTHKAQSPTNKEESVPFNTDLTIFLILMLKRAGERMLSWGTPISCSCRSDMVEPTRTLKSRSVRNPSMKMGRLPLPRDQKECRVSRLYRMLFPCQRKWPEHVASGQRHI